MAMEFVHISRQDLKSGVFPLNHDCILKVRYKPGSLVRKAFFSCRSFESGSIVTILLEFPDIASVECFQVDDPRVYDF